MTTNTPARETQHTPTPWTADGFDVECGLTTVATTYQWSPSIEPYGVENSDIATANAAYIVKCVNGYEALQAQNEALVAALEKYETWLKDRIEWLTREAHGGGNWEHLNTRRCEAAHVLELFRAALAQAKAAKVQP